MCDWATKMTLTPGAMNEADVQKLREHGFSDEAITVAAQVIGYFKYINRVAEGPGVHDEEWVATPRAERV